MTTYPYITKLPANLPINGSDPYMRGYVVGLYDHHTSVWNKYSASNWHPSSTPALLYQAGYADGQGDHHQIFAECSYKTGKSHSYRNVDWVVIERDLPANVLVTVDMTYDAFQIDPFLIFRGTHYRWDGQIWPKIGLNPEGLDMRP